MRTSCLRLSTNSSDNTERIATNRPNRPNWSALLMPKRWWSERTLTQNQMMMRSRQVWVGEVLTILERAGRNGRRQQGDRVMPVDFRLLSALLQEAGDPDANDFHQYAVGVRVGVGYKMPRTPAIYERKTRWKLESQANPEIHLWRAPSVGQSNANYRSARDLEEAVEKQLRESVDKHQAITLSDEEANRCHGSKLVIASLGAMIKDDSGPDLKIRLLFDGTHGVSINTLIRVRDQDRTPAAPDVRRLLRERAKASGCPFGLKIDVKHAHRLVPIAQQDWHLLSCPSGPGRPLYVNTTKTFRVASAAYWWGRLAGAAVRLIHYYTVLTFHLGCPSLRRIYLRSPLAETSARHWVSRLSLTC